MKKTLLDEFQIEVSSLLKRYNFKSLKDFSPELKAELYKLMGEWIFTLYVEQLTKVDLLDIGHSKQFNFLDFNNFYKLKDIKNDIKTIHLTKIILTERIKLNEQNN